MAIWVSFRIFNRFEKVETLRMDASPYAYDICALERALSALRKKREHELAMPELVVSGEEVFKKTWLGEVTIPLCQSDDWYTMSFGYTLPENSEMLWRYMFGKKYGGSANYGDILKMSFENVTRLYLVCDFISLENRDFFWEGDDSPSEIVVRVFPFSEEATQNVAWNIEKLAPKITPSVYDDDYWEHYFRATVITQKPEVFRAKEIEEKGEVCGHVNFETMRILANMLRPYRVR